MRGYSLISARLDDPYLETHIGKKMWCDKEDLHAALSFAREFFSRTAGAAPTDPPPPTVPARDAWMAYCPKGEPYDDHPFAGSILVGTRELIGRVTEEARIGPIALPFYRQVCGPDRLRAPMKATPLVLAQIGRDVFQTYAEMTAFVGLDPQAVHKAFLGITEYRQQMGLAAPSP